MLWNRRRGALFVALITTAVAVFLWFYFVEPIRYHQNWYYRVRHDIMTLAHKRPQSVSKGQWEYIVGWTINLHANCGGIYSTVETNWQEEFAVEFERRLAGPITLTDIAWVWDEYTKHTKYGQSYSDRWRPMNNDEFIKAQEGCFGIPVE